MKKVILIIALAAITFGASAQGFSWGIKAGMNISNIGGKDITGNQNKVGYFAGIATEYGFSDKWSIAPELLFSAQGANGNSGDNKSALKFSYINLPIFAKYYLTEKWSVGLGPQIGYAISVKAKGTVDGKSTTVSLSDKGIQYNKFDFGVGVATSYKFTEKFYVDARYNYGIIKMFDGVKNYNRVFQLGVGYNF